MNTSKAKMKQIVLALLLCTTTTGCWGMNLFKGLFNVKKLTTQIYDICLKINFLIKYEKAFIKEFPNIDLYEGGSAFSKATFENWERDQIEKLKQGQFSLELVKLSFKVLLCEVKLSEIKNELEFTLQYTDKQKEKLKTAQKELEKAENKLKTAQEKPNRKTFSSISKAKAAEKFLRKNMKQHNNMKQLESEEINEKLERLKSTAQTNYFQNHHEKINKLVNNLVKKFKPSKGVKANLEKEAKDIFSIWKKNILDRLKIYNFKIKREELMFESYVMLKLEKYFYEEVESELQSKNITIRSWRASQKSNKRQIIESDIDQINAKIKSKMEEINKHIETNSKGYSSIYAAQKAEGFSSIYEAQKFNSNEEKNIFP